MVAKSTIFKSEEIHHFESRLFNKALPEDLRQQVQRIIQANRPETIRELNHELLVKILGESCLFHDHALAYDTLMAMINHPDAPEPLQKLVREMILEKQPEKVYELASKILAEFQVLKDGRVIQVESPPDEPAITERHDHIEAFVLLALIEKDLNERFAFMKNPIRVVILSVASGEPLLFLGPPGTAKSLLIRSFCEYIGVENGKEAAQAEDDTNRNGTQDSETQDRQNEEDTPTHRRYFDYLLTSFTEPSELFGHFDIIKSKEKGTLVRDTKDKMQHAEVVFLDEVFKGSSAILNSLLSVINEGLFHDRGNVYRVKIKNLFGASNDPPQDQALKAIYDRFLLRVWIDNVKTRKDEYDDLIELIQRGWKISYGPQITHDDSNGDGDVSESDKTASKENALALQLRGGEEKGFPWLLQQLDVFRTSLGETLAYEEIISKLAAGENTFYNHLAAHVDYMRKRGLSDMSNRRIIKLLRVMLIHAIIRSVIRAAGDHIKSVDDWDIESLVDHVRNRIAKEHIVLSESELGLLRFSLDRRDEVLERNLPRYDPVTL